MNLIALIFLKQKRNTYNFCLSLAASLFIYFSYQWHFTNSFSCFSLIRIWSLRIQQRNSTYVNRLKVDLHLAWSPIRAFTDISSIFILPATLWCCTFLKKNQSKNPQTLLHEMRWKSLKGLEAWEIGWSLWLYRLKSLYLWTFCMSRIGRPVPAGLQRKHKSSSDNILPLSLCWSATVCTVLNCIII